MNFEKSAYSINKGLWGTSVGGKETLSSKGIIPEDAWPTPITKNGTEEVKLHFIKGELMKLMIRSFSHPSDAITTFASFSRCLWHRKRYSCG